MKCRTQQIGRIKMAVAVVKILAAANLLVERFMRDVNRDFVSTPLCYSVDLVCHLQNERNAEARHHTIAG